MPTTVNHVVSKMRRSAAPSRSNILKDSNTFKNVELISKPVATKPSEITSSTNKCFEAVFTKASSKKVSMATSFGHRFTFLESLGEGSRVKIGAFEAELMTEVNSSSIPSATPLSMPNKRPCITDTLLEEIKQPSQPSTPGITSRLFNPSGFSDNLVMPKPPSSCVWVQNQEGLPITEVALEASFASRLRPHQREGVVFLYRCVMGFLSPNTAPDYPLLPTDIPVLDSSEGRGVNRSKPVYGCILADEMGLGKTVQVIALIWLLLRQGPYGGVPVIQRCLVVTPSSLVQNWAKEVSKWLGRERLPVYCVDAGHTVKHYLQLPGAPPVLIMSYEMFLQHADAIQSVPNLDLVICDEAHRLKNTNIHTSLALQSLSAHRRVLLTGTPVQNNLDELWSLAEFCAPGRLAPRRLFTAGRRKPEDVEGQRQQLEEEEEDISPSLSSLLSTFLLRRTTEVIRSQLPDKNKLETILLSPIRAALSPSSADRENYRPLSPIDLDSSGDSQQDEGTRAPAATSQWTANGDSVLCIITGLRKLYNHPQLFRDYITDNDRSLPKHLLAQLFSVLTEEEEEEEEKKNSCRQRVQLKGAVSHPLAIESSGKLSVLVHMLKRLFPSANTETAIQLKRKRNSHRLVLVSNFTETLDMLETVCMQTTGRTCLRIDGQTPSKRRQEVVQQFNDLASSPASDILLLSSRAGGSGLNLTGGDHLILFDMDWNPANDAQAMARIWRPGQTRPVRLYRLLTAGGIEERIFQRQTAKSAISVHALDFPLDALLVDASSGSKRSSGVLTKEELRDLFLCPSSSSPVGCWTHELIECTCQQTAHSVLPVEGTESGPLSTHSLASPTLSNSSNGSGSDAGVPSGSDSDPDDSEVRVCQLGRPRSPGQVARRTSQQLTASAGSLACLLGWKHSLSPEAIVRLEDPLLAAVDGDQKPPILTVFSSSVSQFDQA